MNVLYSNSSCNVLHDIKSGKYKLTKYATIKEIDGSIVVCNYKNYIIISLSKEELEQISTQSEDELKNNDTFKFLVINGFLVPIDKNEEFDTNYINKLRGKFNKCNSYTIYTTFGCNANCPYCYEHDMNKSFKMSKETAHNVVKFIKANSNLSKAVHIQWFGGEPLMNKPIINQICNELVDEGIQYNSTMISNGYLIKSSEIGTYKNLWKLYNVQITLDGTEDTYNRIKGYKIKTSAFKRVIKNIDILIYNKIHVTVRINISNENYEDCAKLVDFLIERYKRKSFILIYAHIIFDLEHVLNKDVYENLFINILNLNYKLCKSNLGTNLLFEHKFPGCGAFGGTLNIYPTGKLKRCEHIGELFENDLGNVNVSMDYDKDFIFNENELSKMLSDDCLNCKYLPTCRGITQCPIFSLHSLHDVCVYDKPFIDKLETIMLRNALSLKNPVVKNNEKFIC